MPIIAVAVVAGLVVLLALVLLVRRAALRDLDERHGPGEDAEPWVEGHEDENPMVKLVNRIIEDAYTRGASAVHLIPGEAAARVLYRIDGALEERMTLPARAMPAVIGRVSLMAKLPPREPGRVHQGRFPFLDFSARGLDVDLSVARWQGSDGEQCVLQLLAKGSISLGLDAVELSAENLALVRGALRAPRGGLVLFSGAAGSGRTTTMYCARSELEATGKRVVHVRPDEYYPWVAGIDGSNFHLLDADALVVGELADEATARLALECAKSGRVVLATIFAEDVGMAVARLLGDLEQSPLVVSMCLRAVVAQRLARRLCKCREQGKAPAKPDCDRCRGSGFKGRVALHEAARVEGELLAAIRAGTTSPAELQRAAVAAGLVTLAEDAQRKAELGLIDLSDTV